MKDDEMEKKNGCGVWGSSLGMVGSVDAFVRHLAVVSVVRLVGVEL